MRHRYPTIATAITALIAQACGLVSSNPAHHDNPPVAGSSGSSGQASGGSSSTGGLVLNQGGEPSDMLPEACASAVAPFADQVVTQIGEQRVFYSWTTDEQVAELRAGGELFSRSERPGMGRGLLFTELSALGEAGATLMNELALVLANQTFAKARFAWTNPWATIMGFPGEDYGNQLLRIELKPDAWIAFFADGGLRVFDQENNEVPLQVASASPERIGAIYYESRAEAGNCYSGTFAHGGVGFREFALGNLEMVQNWSLATPEIAERLQSDIGELEEFAKILNCFGDFSDWSTRVTCDWGSGQGQPDALNNYEFALGLPSELYRPTALNIEAVIAALEASMPTGEPMIVVPPQ
ncbi:MAG TPA: hypothetical protein VHP33_13060 [Polyangiaceae bacterium]|nr:hypothetical protein [Polyangiaceae bacterium]